MIIGVGGATCTGKTSISKGLARHYFPHSEIFSVDNYMLGRSCRGGLPGSHPNCIDWGRMLDDLHTLIIKKKYIWQNPYDHSTGSVDMGRGVLVRPKDVLIIDGTLSLSDVLVKDFGVDGYFINVAKDTLYLLRSHENVFNRGYDRLESDRTFEPEWRVYEDYIYPTIKNASVVYDLSIDINGVRHYEKRTGKHL